VFQVEGVKGIKAVLFDVDDTLFDSTTLAKMASARAL
jgi:FMN phosphatase YigB (HAD superfamily)